MKEVLDERAVLKFGGSIQDPSPDDPTGPARESVERICDEIEREARPGRKVLAVVSAARGVSNELYARRELFAERTDEFAREVAQGELRSAEEVGRALEERRRRVRVLPLDETGIVTRGDVLAARPETLEPGFFARMFERHDVLVVPGHVGRDCDVARLTLLGRGGSDYSAFFLAVRLRAGLCAVYSSAGCIWGAEGPGGRPLERISWAELLQLPNVPVQTQAADFARANGLTVQVRALGSDRPGTTIDGTDLRSVAG